MAALGRVKLSKNNVPKMLRVTGVVATAISTGTLRDHGALHRHRHASATTLRLISLSPRGILQWPEEQSRSGGGQDGGNADQSQHRRMWRCRSSCPLILARPSPPCQNSCSQPPPPPRRSLVRGGLTRTHRPRLVVSLSTCPPFSLSPPLTAYS